MRNHGFPFSDGPPTWPGSGQSHQESGGRTTRTGGIPTVGASPAWVETPTAPTWKVSSDLARKQRRCLEYELTDRDWRTAQERIETLEAQKREVAQQLHKARAEDPNNWSVWGSSKYQVLPFKNLNFSTTHILREYHSFWRVPTRTKVTFWLAVFLLYFFILFRDDFWTIWLINNFSNGWPNHQSGAKIYHKDVSISWDWKKYSSQ